MRLFLLSVFLFTQLIAYTQSNLKLFVFDQSRQEPLVQALVSDKQSGKYAYTDEKGYAELRVDSKKEIQLYVSLLGYLAIDTLVKNNGVILKFYLQSNTQLEDVEVLANKNDQLIGQEDNGTITVNQNTLLKIPQSFGEPDLVKSILLLPGVNSGFEGSRGIYVRGGTPDQNLMLYDGIPIYNATHVYGFLSTINTDAISSLSFQKNELPAKYGGRLGSLTDIDPQTGNNKNLKGSATIGLINSKLHLDGPLSPKTSFSLSLRACYAGMLSKPISKVILSKDGGGGFISYYFYDGVFTVEHQFNERNKLRLSTFFVHDEFVYNKQKKESLDDLFFSSDKQHEESMKWNNSGANLSYMHRTKNNWMLRSNLIFAQYDLKNINNNYYQEVYNGTETYTEKKENENKSFVRDFSFQQQANCIIGRNQNFSLGIGTDYRSFLTGKGFIYREENHEVKKDVHFGNRLEKTMESYAYVENQLFHEKYELKVGFRLVHYNHISYNPVFFEPRASFMYRLHKYVQFHSSFMQTNQSVHLLTSANADLINDLWVPATDYIKPENAWQANVGFSGKDWLGLEWSADVYYRSLSNLVTFKEGESYLLFGDDWQNQLYNEGKGKSYGAEFYVARNLGKLTAWFKYNLSWSDRSFEQINDAKPYPFKYDRRHDFSCLINYKINDRFDVSLAYVYGNGYRTTLPNYIYEGDYILYLYEQNQHNPDATSNVGYLAHYDGRNNYQLPAYHRLDLSLNYTKVAKRVTHLVNFSIYNVYNRKNVFLIYSDAIADGTGAYQVKYYQLTIFPIMPSLSYTIKFQAKKK